MVMPDATLWGDCLLVVFLHPNFAGDCIHIFADHNLILRVRGFPDEKQGAGPRV